MSTIITKEQVEQYKRDGFVILRNVISQEMIQKIQGECERFIKEKHAEMDAKGVEVDEINHKGKRYFIAMKNKSSQPMQELLFGKEMEEITRSILGDDVYLFLEQYVVKAADKGMKFAWHQDSGYVKEKHNPYLSCWLPLDDVNEENGTVYLLTYDEAGTRERIDHFLEEGTNDMIGYAGDNPGTSAILEKGDIALFSSVCFHRSGSNNTDKSRRVLLMQYSDQPILKDDGSPLYLADPFLVNGKLQK
ncbi:phytanoyl-CoA dioxygenase family protein [uncultured Sunxiuqinia sp.]|uniref:phytanoyl-CoA dioxygenase family protein n=1 Tax=uncultured Sunxiuqinia sp. TaxID=1573825 RepID=UPI002AA8E6D3|nr:phytanoyl-CoA dioxygenase family protein [uncultured Sunxiuqinia sp.]